MFSQLTPRTIFIGRSRMLYQWLSTDSTIRTNTPLGEQNVLSASAWEHQATWGAGKNLHGRGQSGLLTSTERNPRVQALHPCSLFHKASGGFGSLFKKLEFPTILKDLRLWKDPTTYLFCSHHKLVYWRMYCAHVFMAEFVQCFTIYLLLFRTAQPNISRRT